MPQIKHDILINAKIEIVYQALTTAEGLKAWFTSQVNGSGQVGTDWQLKFTDQPFFCWQITASDSPTHVAWKCLEGPGNAKKTEVNFSLKSSAATQTVLTIAHLGWERDDPKFSRCVDIWRTLMNHLQQYCETRIAAPAYH